MSAALREAKNRRAEDRKAEAMEMEGQRLLASSAGAAGAGVEEGPYSSLRAKLQALLVLAVSVWGLWEGKVVQGLLHNPRTDSTALAVAVGASSLVVLLWGYLDLYVGAVKGQKVQYTDVRTVTHCILLGLFASGLALICALWPVHRAASLVYVAMLSYGVLFQVILLVPAAIYNPLFLFGFAAFVYFWAR